MVGVMVQNRMAISSVYECVLLHTSIAYIIQMYTSM
jgi:hypothetical protein